MSFTLIDQAHSRRPRLETLLMFQQALKRDRAGRLDQFEVEVAIEELQSGWPTPHTETVERMALAYLGGAA